MIARADHSYPSRCAVMGYRQGTRPCHPLESGSRSWERPLPRTRDRSCTCTTLSLRRSHHYRILKLDTRPITRSGAQIKLAQKSGRASRAGFPHKLLKINNLVEAAGVEPASENAASKEPTYLVSFRRRLPGTLANRAQNGQETRPASLKVSPRTPRRRVRGQLTVRRPFPAHEQSRGGRQLN